MRFSKFTCLNGQPYHALICEHLIFLSIKHFHILEASRAVMWDCTHLIANFQNCRALPLMGSPAGRKRAPTSASPDQEDPGLGSSFCTFYLVGASTPLLLSALCLGDIRGQVHLVVLEHGSDAIKLKMFGALLAGSKNWQIWRDDSGSII